MSHPFNPCSKISDHKNITRSFAPSLPHFLKPWRAFPQFPNRRHVIMKQRTITAVFFAAAMIGGIYGGVWPFFFLFLTIATGSLWEFLGLMLSREQTFYLGKRLMGTLLGLAALLMAVCHRFAEVLPAERLQPFLNDWPFVLTLLIGWTLLVELFGTSKAPFQNIGYYAVGIFYIALPVAMLFDVASLSDYHPHRVMGILWLIWTNDTMAYLIGSQIGRRKLFERISPKKTWEGTIGGAICTVLMAWIISLYFNDFSPAQWLAVGAMVGIFGTLGDLVESMLKRSIGVKDSGTLLPGHGGLLDRFDSFLFVVGFVWVAVKWLSVIGY